MVEDELLAERLEEGTDDEQRIRRIRNMDDVEASANRHPARQEQHRRRRVREFERVSDHAVSTGRGWETIDVDPVEPFGERLACRSRRDDCDVEARLVQRMRFPTDPDVERECVVLDEEQDPT